MIGDKRFTSALSGDENRPDMLAVAAIIDGEIAGLAGASSDIHYQHQLFHERRP